MVKICASVASITRPGSASSKTTTGDFPPSSTEDRFSVSAPAAITRRPVLASPVNAIRSTLGCAESGAPTVSPNPCTTLKTPRGTPASSSTEASSVDDSGDHSAGFRTIVFPAASAGAMRQVESMSGAFHGMIKPATPTGLKIV